jgi:hypothetical protein
VCFGCFAALVRGAQPIEVTHLAGVEAGDRLSLLAMPFAANYPGTGGTARKQ